MIKPSLKITRVFRASTKRIYEAWTSATELKSWHCPQDMTISKTECDPSIGGRYSITMLAPDGSQHRAAGSYLELTPYSKISFTWEWEVGGDPANGSQVTIELRDLGDYTTELTLFHERLENEEAKDAHHGGWSSAFNNLEQHILT